MSSSSSSMAATYLMLSLILITLSATPHFTLAITPDDEQISSASSQLQIIIQALIDSNGDEILFTKPFNSPFSATYLIPIDNPSLLMIMNTNSTTSSSSSFTLDYHIIPQKLTFSELKHLPIGSSIPTLAPGKSIRVTNNSQSNYSINNVIVSNPNMYMNEDIVIHGIKSSLDFDVCHRFIDDKSKRSQTISHEQQNVVHSLLSTQFQHWAKALCRIPPSRFPANATFLVSPSDPTSGNSRYSVGVTVSFHLIPQYLPFSVLKNLDVGSKIGTDYYGESIWKKSILVTNNSASNYTVEDVLITHPDLYLNAGLVVHGIESTLKVKNTVTESLKMFFWDNRGTLWCMCLLVIVARGI
ncbi:hypothetical protein MKW92_004704 [Papaver armeniacum]|nr:hypothetical protein MKW92_004704 [Papaver armeniacum]